MKKILATILAALLLITSCGWTGIAVYAAEPDDLNSGKMIETESKETENSSSDSESEAEDAVSNDDNESELDVNFEKDISEGVDSELKTTSGIAEDTSDIESTDQTLNEEKNSDSREDKSPSGESAAASVETQDDSASSDGEGTEGYLSYKISNGEATITKCDQSASGDLIIPEMLGVTNVTSIGNGAFSGCSSLTSIEIPDSVTSIGKQTFRDCSSLTSIEIPDSVTSIGEWAFYDCSSLTSIEIPSSVTTIGNAAFYSCNQLICVNVSNNNNNFSSQNGVLFDKNKTELLCLPGGIKGNYIIPNSVTSIGNESFIGCSNLTSIEIPESVISIGEKAFSGCSSLNSIEIPDSVTSIGSDAFSYCSSLTNIEIPDNITIISDGVFSNCSSLTSIVIPNSVTSIGEDAFCDCGSLTSIKIPNGVTDIGDSAFSGCSSLISIVIPDSVTSIGSNAFYWCFNLKSIEIPDGVNSIDESTFERCSSLTRVEIPDSVIRIEEWAFSRCSSLASIVIPASVTEIGMSAFSNCNSLTNIKIPGSMTIISDGVFSGCSSLTSIEIPSSVAGIGGNAFQECDLLSDVYYTGSKDQWDNILVKSGNDALNKASIHYNDSKSEHQITFTDVEGHQYFYEAVKWGVKSKTVSGFSESDGTYTFRPNDTCTRAQFVTFLWRALGEQKPKNTENPFKDIRDIGSQYYGTALLWAYENHYVSGYSDSDGVRFGPDDQITRGQVVTFLWRAAGEPKATTTISPFKDVTKPEEQYYGQAMLWASENGIVSGYSDPDGARFAPDDSCTRGQVVTFLWRYHQWENKEVIDLTSYIGKNWDNQTQQELSNLIDNKKIKISNENDNISGIELIENEDAYVLAGLKTQMTFKEAQKILVEKGYSNCYSPSGHETLSEVSSEDKKYCQQYWGGDGSYDFNVFPNETGISNLENDINIADYPAISQQLQRMKEQYEKKYKNVFISYTTICFFNKKNHILITLVLPAVDWEGGNDFDKIPTTPILTISAEFRFERYIAA